jgi:hypothetical protein
MRTNATDLLEPRRGDTAPAELRRMGANIIAVDIADQHEGC